MRERKSKRFLSSVSWALNWFGFRTGNFFVFVVGHQVAALDSIKIAYHSKRKSLNKMHEMVQNSVRFASYSRLKRIKCINWFIAGLYMFIYFRFVHSF